MTTKNGIVKRTDLMEFSRARKSGIIACTLADNDKLIGAAVTSGSDEVILATKSGMSIRFRENDVRTMGRSARGVTGIRFHDDTDAVVSMTIVPKGTEEEALTLLTACENGYGKRTKISQYRLQGRGGKGVIDIQTTDRNGPVISAYAVDDSAEAMLITSSGKIIRMKSKDISVIGRNTQGVKLIDLDEGEKVVAISPLIEEE
jgi:DNA gyrase subunit A